jgi:flagellar FliL protein
MSDTDGLDMDDGESPDSGAAPKKRGGLALLIPTILKFAAIGIGALIFIVTVAAVTYSFMNKGGKSQTQIPGTSEPFVGKRPVYSMYTGIGTINTRTRDERSHNVTIVMIIGYDTDDAESYMELNSRQYELRDFLRNYFSGKYAIELMPENEVRLKQDIKDILNNRFLDTAKVRQINFDRLDVMNVY